MMPITGTSNVNPSTSEVSFEYDMDSFKMTPKEQQEYLEHEVLYAMMLADVRQNTRIS